MKLLALFLALVIPAAATADELKDLTRTFACQLCHKREGPFIGPSWLNISERYKYESTYFYELEEYPLVEGLVKKVSYGEHNTWKDPEASMLANDYELKHQPEITKIIKDILNLQKSKK